MQRIVPFLWFDKEAEEAAKFYTSIFKDSKIGKISKFGGPDEKDSVMVAEFELNGQQFMAMNAGPQFKFNEAISLLINCASQDEVDYYWEKLTADGGEESMCGWLKDKYGLSWQVYPTILGEMMTDKDKAKAGRVMQAMMKMKKIDIGELKKAYEG